MKQEDIEMPEDYKERLAQLTEMLEAREELVKHAGEVPADERAHYNSQLRKLDKTIDEMETMLAKERDRIELVRAKEADLSAKIAVAWDLQKQIYIHIKYELPDQLADFTEKVLGPLPDDVREEFLDDVAILEATKLDAILKGEA